MPQTMRFDVRNALSDFARANYKTFDESLQILDQFFLVCDERIQFNSLQVHLPLKSAHERLRSRCQAFEPTAQKVKCLECFSFVQRLFAGKDLKLTEITLDVLQCLALQFAGTHQPFVENGNCTLGGFALVRELIEIARAVKLFDGRHVAGVAMRFKVAPLAE